MKKWLLCAVVFNELNVSHFYLCVKQIINIRVLLLQVYVGGGGGNVKVLLYQTW